MAFGVINDIADDASWFVASEAGISLSRGESYVLIGVGARFGGGGPSLSRSSGEKSPHAPRTQRTPRKNSRDEFRTEDFSE
ncbi:MAG: hypothetical protein HUU37_06750 [Bdellovibrionales bacterium]|nr:hypothetical protein [Bdellovibrionales bacterium]